MPLRLTLNRTITKPIRQGTPDRESPATPFRDSGVVMAPAGIAERPNKNAEFEKMLINGLGKTRSENRSFG